MSPEELKTDKVEELIDVQVGDRVSRIYLVIDQSHDGEQFGIIEVDSVKQLGLPAISHLIRAG
jgi:hypothetical protein